MSPSSHSPHSRLRILTLNCWGLKYVSKYRTERVAAIADFIAGSEYDLVTLQELWVFSDYEHVRSVVAKQLPHSKFFYSGALGAGLVIFSKYPIIAATVHPYSLNGSPVDVIAGDWFVGKAAASVILSHPILGQLQVFNTHLFAKGGDEGPDQQKAHRLVNAWEFAKYAREAAELGRYVIAAGDFNSVPTAPPMSIIRDHATLSDAWVDTHTNVRPPAAGQTITPIDAIHTYGVTADSPLNSYSAGKTLEPNARKFQGKRLDYVFYRGPSSALCSAPRLKAVDTRVLLTERVPGHIYSFSDHFGLEATFDITSDPNHTLIPPLSITFATCHLLGVLGVASCSHHRLGVVAHSWINPIFMVASVGFTWLATTMLYIGFVYGNWEINALTNVIEELEIHRDTIEDQTKVSPL
ncbi:hypothetical protein NLI96_g3026 [Meripilus lineatus]|uniref:Endonuclease/exonuclease/phosphatase domain-containing protein n=1 Tax=Meripilus lineatus TaxID=2056292 RepID=A0AAD5V949_9APHY|nr:hypothetical protein NLI96_g3026 [Physisporinus lineatus]